MSSALTDAEWRELVAAAVEMARKAKQEQQRAEEAEYHIEQLRAALEATEADLSASQDHDGAEGQGEGEKAADRRCPTCGIPFAHYTHDPQGRPL